MKFAQIAIGSILLIEAILLLYSPQQRYNFHTFAEFIKSQFQQSGCGCLKSLCYMCIEKLRFFVVALILTGGFSLTFGNNIIVGIIAQLLWTVTQSQLYYGQGLNDIRNTLVQVLFLIILLGDFGKSWAQCKAKREANRKQSQLEQRKTVEQEAAPIKKSEQPKKTQQKPKQKQESKKSK